MAPEFFPFLALGVLAVIELLALSACVILLIARRHDAHRRKALRTLTVLTFSGAALVMLLLYLIGARIHQRCFLDEPLVDACGRGDVTEVRRLLSSGASPDAYGVDDAETALIAAARAGHAEVVTVLLRKGAHIGLEDRDGKTALHRAREAGQSDIVSLLEWAVHPQ